MMNILKDLAKLGLSNLADRSIFEEDQKAKKTDKEEVKVTVEEVLYDKTYSCPICNKSFKSKAIRTGKNRLMGSDSDFKAYFSVVDPIIYDVITCSCGYTAMTRSFDVLINAQRTFIRNEICANYKVIEFKQIRTVEDAILLYKLALANAMIKMGKSLEKGLICLRIAWLYRDLKDEINEKIYIEHAIIGFQEALNKERFPMLGIEDNLAMYLVADLSYRVGRKEEALRWLSVIVTSRAIPARIKEKAVDLKHKIKTEENNK